MATERQLARRIERVIADFARGRGSHIRIRHDDGRCLLMVRDRDEDIWYEALDLTLLAEELAREMTVAS